MSQLVTISDDFETELIQLIESVIDCVSDCNICVGLSISGELDNLPAFRTDFIYNTCQEALVNSIMHGKAENIIIEIECVADMLRVKIADDGQGCMEISKNNGLTDMENCTKTLGGKIGFVSTSSGGFGIYAEIPV
jgi:signal transduction histidine kinase